MTTSPSAHDIIFFGADTKQGQSLLRQSNGVDIHIALINANTSWSIIISRGERDRFSY